MDKSVAHPNGTPWDWEHSTGLIYCSVASPRKVTRSAYQFAIL
jgi:hypothetical protein